MDNPYIKSRDKVMIKVIIKSKYSKGYFGIIFFILVLSIPIFQNSFAFQEQSFNKYKTLNGVDYPTWDWTMTEVISTGGLNTGYDSSITVDPIGNVYILWKYYTGGMNATLYLSTWNVTTNSWSTPEIVSTNRINHPSLCIDSDTNIHVSWTDSTDILGAGTDYDVFYKFRNATTLNWSTLELVSTESANQTYDPKIAVDIKGSVHVVWNDYTDPDAGDNDVAYKFKNATNGVWNTTEIISVGSGDSSTGQDIGVDLAGNIHIIWRDYESNYYGSDTDVDVFYRFWNATSFSWHDVELVSSESTYFVTGPSLAMDSGGNAHIVWQDGTNILGSGNDYDVFYKIKNATSLSWTTLEVVSTESTNSIGSPEITIDSKNNVHVLWAESFDYTGEGSDRDIYYKFKNATSLSWNLTEVVSTESTDQSQDAFLSVDLFGTVHFTWQDNTDYLGAGTDTDIHYKRLYISNLPTTVLDPIDPNPSTTGNVTLNWGDVEYASKYYVYRSTSSISSLIGLNPIAVSYVNAYQDNFVSNDYYYYVIVAATPYINSSMSNEETVVVNGPYITEFSPNVLIAVGLTISTALIVILRRRKKKH
ncbi:MAG: hypothetical protein HeimAB125_23030 [Candidatus Heimdallarchaeota archaeon AB_125]|nr:MAG: hypothetical protein HeimAB125_23030 [Candidatus Heimdallarchaeota archaeon AB_125]